MSSLRFVYAGNRSGVLREMQSLGLRVIHILPVVNSWLDRETAGINISRSVVASKTQAVAEIQQLEFDVLLSVGFPFILPISALQESGCASQFINVHPSLLPDLRGADPIPGAILHSRDAGVSVHHMDDGIDTGPLISQTKISHQESMDAKLLYHLCFQLEPEVFRDALMREFQPMDPQPQGQGALYYTFHESDLRCRDTDSDEQLQARIRAFNTPRKGAIVCVAGPNEQRCELRVFDGKVLGKELTDRFPDAVHNEIVGVYEDCLLVRREDRLWSLSGIRGDIPFDILGHRICT